MRFETNPALLFEEFERFAPDNLIGLGPELQPVYRHVLRCYRDEHPGTRAGSPLPDGLPGFNAGVTLLDLGRMRRSEVYNRALTPEAVAALVAKYHFKGHLGDQDFYTLLGLEHEELFYKLDCAWNRQLCTWWKDRGYRDVFDQYRRCDGAVKMYHGNCSTPIPDAAAAPVVPAPEAGPPRDERMHLAVTACGDRLDEALTMLKSAVVATRARLTLHVFADDALRPQFQERLSAWPEEARRKFELRLYPISYPGADEPETWRKLFKPCASQRLFYPYLIEGTERVLYVDTDVLFLRPPEDVWRFFDAFAPEQIAALAPESEDVRNGWYPRFAKHPYFEPAGVNSGVMLMDLARMRRARWRERLIAYQKQYKSIPWGDQDLINIFFAESPEKLYVHSCEWNYRPDHCRDMSNCKAAQEHGVAIVHGNRGAFHGDKQPTFRALYDAFDAFGFGQDVPTRLLQPLRAGLAAAAATPDRCAAIGGLLTRPLEQAAEAASRGDGYYHDVAVAQLAPWRATGIRPEDLDAAVKATPWPLTRYQIRGGHVFRSAECMFPARCKGIEHFLLEIAPELGKDVEFVVNVQDVPVSSVKHPLPVFSFSKVPAQHADILYPAWAFWEGGPALEVIPEWRWDLTRRELLDAGAALPWRARKPVLFFRGSRTSPTRDPYVLHSQKAGSAWDVQFTLNQSRRDTEYVSQVLKLAPAQPVSPRDHCAYRYLLNFDGVAASFRLKNLLACGGLVFYVEPKFFYSKLVPWEHYVPLGLDVAEAARVVDALKADDARAQRIARGGREFIEKHLTLDDVRRYWLDLLREYASVQKFTPRRDDGLTTLVSPPAAPVEDRSEAK